MYRRFPKDIYRCISCEKYIAHGDRFCRFCGKRFTTEDVEAMKNALKWFDFRYLTPWFSGPSPVTHFRCVACAGFVSAQDEFCRVCGHRFSEKDKKAMGFHMMSRIQTGCVIVFSLFMLVLFVSLYLFVG